MNYCCPRYCFRSDAMPPFGWSLVSPGAAGGAGWRHPSPTRPVPSLPFAGRGVVCMSAPRASCGHPLLSAAPGWDRDPPARRAHGHAPVAMFQPRIALLVEAGRLWHRLLGDFLRRGIGKWIVGLLAPARRRPPAGISRPAVSFAQFCGEGGGVALRQAFAGSMSNLMRVGSATPSPKVMASPAPMVGMNSSRLAAASEMPALQDLLVALIGEAQREDRVALATGWSGSSSAGRCVTMHSDTPYLRPSLAMREIARLVGSKPSDLVDRHIAMRFLAHEGDRDAPAAPHAEIEGEPRQHRDDDIDDLGRQAAEFEDGDRLAVDRHAEDRATAPAPSCPGR